MEEPGRLSNEVTVLVAHNARKAVCKVFAEFERADLVHPRPVERQAAYADVRREKDLAVGVPRHVRVRRDVRGRSGWQIVWRNPNEHESPIGECCRQEQDLVEAVPRRRRACQKGHLRIAGAGCAAWLRGEELNAVRNNDGRLAPEFVQARKLITDRDQSIRRIEGDALVVEVVKPCVGTA
jgi:hypothetical protein